MDSNQEATIPLTFWVNEGEEEEKYVVIEASGDFVDVLFSFLTLPLGTIMRLVSKKNKPLEIGCINNLYHSVEKFSTDDVFWNHMCKQMLLSPRNPLEASCKRLKVKVDDTEPTKYLMCGRCSKGGDLLLSTFDGARCYCGNLMRIEMKLAEESKKEASGDNGSFVKRDAMFLIFNDLRVLQSSPGNTIQQLRQLGYKDINKITKKTLNVGKDEIFSTLEQALTSKSLLCDALLTKRGPKPMMYSPDTDPSQHMSFIKLKITMRKSENKILFVEAEGDFVDFLFSFLSIPLGSILNLMNGKSSLGNIDNLYTSVKNLNPSWFIGSSKNSLLNPGVANKFGCVSQPMLVPEEDTPRYWYGSVVGKANIRRNMISKNKDMVEDPVALKLFDPRSSDGARESPVGFTKRPFLFVVSDDLQVKPMTTTSSILYVQELNVPLDDFEEHLVEIKNSREALNLFWASLTSKVALTHSLFHLVKKRECEMCILGCIRWKKDRYGNKGRDGKKKEKEEEKIEKCNSKEKEEEKLE
ncbi:uncharacterized protein LOC109789748 [Cajanus cajan]|uniref:DUF674 family protein n=1 Tax=Cajanus cajan TaxID=3821 RepID=A0A151R5Y4_CAJCA|nr:uncharacterized protein LOC109789748 [Cajanus cajan]KYP37972.1 hypothetical protein KK1_040805 [Cajanus cajan]